MQKKPGQISANTLGLRFMQNAAKAKYEQELEAATAKVKSEEEWEVSQSVRHGWGIPDSVADGTGTVTYEQSYLPFLFPSLSDSRAATVASSSTAKRHNDGNPDREDAPSIVMKGRRAFGKHGKEKETIQETPSEPPAPSPAIGGAAALPRRVKAISSHGRNAVSLSDSSRPATTGPSSVLVKPPAPQAAPSMASAMKATPVFMKPQVDAPRTDSGERKKRSPDMGTNEDAQRKKKKKRKVQDV